MFPTPSSPHISACPIAIYCIHSKSPPPLEEFGADTARVPQAILTFLVHWCESRSSMKVFLSRGRSFFAHRIFLCRSIHIGAYMTLTPFAVSSRNWALTIPIVRRNFCSGSNVSLTPHFQMILAVLRLGSW
jgi:hypothetical protein